MTYHNYVSMTHRIREALEIGGRASTFVTTNVYIWKIMGDQNFYNGNFRMTAIQTATLGRRERELRGRR